VTSGQGRRAGGGRGPRSAIAAALAPVPALGWVGPGRVYPCSLASRELALRKQQRGPPPEGGDGAPAAFRRGLRLAAGLAAV